MLLRQEAIQVFSGHHREEALPGAPAAQHGRAVLIGDQAEVLGQVPVVPGVEEGQLGPAKGILWARGWIITWSARK